MPTKKIRFYEFSVEGAGQFPVDMLRYDACYPHHQEDVTTAFKDGPRPHLPKRVVHLLSTVKPPTPERWHSFGWTVLDVKAVA